MGYRESGNHSFFSSNETMMRTFIVIASSRLGSVSFEWQGAAKPSSHRSISARGLANSSMPRCQPVSENRAAGPSGEDMGRTSSLSSRVPSGRSNSGRSIETPAMRVCRRRCLSIRASSLRNRRHRFEFKTMREASSGGSAKGWVTSMNRRRPSLSSAILRDCRGHSSLLSQIGNSMDDAFGGGFCPES